MVNLLSAVVWLGLGCAHDKMAIRDDAHERQLLSTSARLHWDGVRWGDVDRASQFIEAPELRAAYRLHFGEQLSQKRFTEVAVVNVTVHEDPERGPSDPWRTGDVLVRAEAFTLPAQIVKVEDIAQRWYRTPDGWWLDWTPHAP